MEANGIITDCAWKKIDPALAVGELTPALLAADIQQAAPIQADLDSLDAQLTDLRNRRPPPPTPFGRGTSPKSDMEVLVDKFMLIVGFGGGREGVGGTRMSERKSPTRKPAA